MKNKLFAAGFCLALSISFISCKKDGALKVTVLSNNGSLYKPILPQLPGRLSFECIYSYRQLIAELESNFIIVESVVLSDGTAIHSGGYILGMTYTAYNTGESYSLFRSELNVRYNLYGYQQENTNNCWSLGCVYAEAGVPPFTCIIKGSKVLLINTSFTWSLSRDNGKRILYLILK